MFITFNAAAGSLLSYAIYRPGNNTRWRFSGAFSPVWNSGGVALAPADFAANLSPDDQGLNTYQVWSVPTGFAEATPVGTELIVYVYSRAGATITLAEMQAAAIGVQSCVWNGAELVPPDSYKAGIALPSVWPGDDAGLARVQDIPTAAEIVAQSIVKATAGLTGYNQVCRDFTYDDFGNLTSFRIRVYSGPDTATDDDPENGLEASFLVSNTLNVQGKIIKTTTTQE